MLYSQELEIRSELLILWTLVFGQVSSTSCPSMCVVGQSKLPSNQSCIFGVNVFKSFLLDKFIYEINSNIGKMIFILYFTFVIWMIFFLPCFQPRVDRWKKPSPSGTSKFSLSLSNFWMCMSVLLVATTLGFVVVIIVLLMLIELSIF